MTSTQPGQALSLTLRRVFAVMPERVFQAWTTPEELKRWFAPPGLTTPEAEVDLRVGGRYRIAMQMPQGPTLWVAGTYVEIDRPNRLVYTWAWEEDGSPGHETLVTVEFNALDGQTELVLTHERLADDAERDQHSDGWNGCFAALEVHLAS